MTFRLTDSDETRRHYPFAFALDITYSIAGATLAVDVAVRNTGEVTLPASFGFHPAFAWPLPYGHDKRDHRIVFAADEPERLREIASDGTIAADTRASPLDGRVLHLRDDLFTDDALVWNDVRSDHVVYGASEGPQLRVDFPDTPKLGIWTRPGAHYICIEPWHGIADPRGLHRRHSRQAGNFRGCPRGREANCVAGDDYPLIGYTSFSSPRACPGSRCAARERQRGPRLKAGVTYH